MGRDWNKSPYVGIELKQNGEFCNPGWEDVYERVFGGLSVACDCIGVSRYENRYWMTG